ERLASTLGASYSEMCICSTGVIGVPLPMELIFNGIGDCASSLSESGSLAAATAIMTTDTVAKEFAAEITLEQGPVRLGAIAKGSGMISPNMATMICIITTDAAIAPELSQTLLRDAVRSSFNRISVDNDMSTSDTVLLFANGRSSVAVQESSADASTFAESLTAFCQEVAKALVKDGEGATKFVEIAVSGTVTDDGAERIARAIGNSQLCKTAFFGEDPNWGRFACAAGYAGVDFDPASLDIRLGGVQLTHGGLVADYAEDDAAAVMLQDEFRLELAVGNGSGKAVFWTSDLSHEYVSINADYRS
ncbi:MAG TPA: bifunctional glutamate N-acetyltransferase/amino-acid acetyltransferase ArgJ, partial [Gammaproteobacteria bacterium]|nr:bifunctional glutamate N-acetyltransferase/amino-acid acetyltransferase ArgJ [Gammaproteobacteria bacterium]